MAELTLGGPAVPQLVGRSSDEGKISADIIHGGGSLVVGATGMGKSALARAVLTNLRSQVVAVRIYASAGLAEVPFGALAPYLGSLQAEQAESMAAATRSLLAYLKDQGRNGQPVVLLIDDVHHLDDSSAVLAAQLVASGSVKLLALTRATTQTPQEIRALAEDGLLTQHVLAPLDAGQSQELCEVLLGGRVQIGVGNELHRLSRGNPMFLTALLEQYRRDGTLVLHNGRWIQRGEPQAPNGELGRLLRNHFGRYSAEELELLETVALADPVPLGALLRTVAGQHLDALVDAGAITVGEDSQRLVRIGHPLHAEMLRAMVPAARSLRIRQRLAAELLAAPTTSDGLLRRIDWALSCGVPVPAEDLLQAARRANSLVNPRFALRAASAVKDRKYLLAARVQMARAHFYSGNLAVAKEHLQGVLEETRCLLVARDAAVLGVKLVAATGDDAAALYRLSDAWERAVERLERQDRRLHGHRATALARAGAQLVRIYAMMIEGQLTRAGQLADTISKAAFGSTETTFVARMLLGEVLASTSRSEEGLAQSAQALKLLHRHEDQLSAYYELLLTSYALTALRREAWDDLRRELDHYVGSGVRGFFYGAGAVSFWHAGLAIVHGGVESGMDLLRTAIEVLRHHDVSRLLPLALALGAYTAATSGSFTEARRLLKTCGEVRYRAPVQLQLLADGLEAAASHLADSHGPGLAKLPAVVGAAERHGLTTAQLELAMLLQRLAEVSNTEEPAALHNGAAGMLERVGRGVRSAGPAPAAKGSAAHAVTRAAAARLQVDKEGRQREQTVIGSAGAAAGASGADIASGLKLTRREHDIGELVLMGLRNAEIAERLGLSVRTVEGHLYRMYAKLQIAGRDALLPRHLAPLHPPQ